MPPLVQVKCTRCQCSHSYAKDSAELEDVNGTGIGLPRKGLNAHCSCECHHLYPLRRIEYPQLVSRTLDFGDEPPY